MTIKIIVELIIIQALGFLLSLITPAAIMASAIVMMDS